MKRYRVRESVYSSKKEYAAPVYVMDSAYCFAVVGKFTNVRAAEAFAADLNEKDEADE